MGHGEREGRKGGGGKVEGWKEGKSTNCIV